MIVSFTESAYADLEDIENYISEDSPAVARKFISRIFDRIDQLYMYPESGKFLPEIKDNKLCELLLNKYRIIYRIVDEEHIDVIRVIHGARLLDL